MNNTSLMWTAVALVGAYVAYEAFNPSRRQPGVHEAGRSNVVFQPDEADTEAIPEANAPPAPEAAPEADAVEADAVEAVQHGGRDIGAEYDQDERARLALAARQEENAANPQRVNAWKQRGTVGTKKAKSLAKRDQRRAYYEYIRQEAEHERERIAAEEQMFGDLIAEEREEREARVAEARRLLDEQNRERREREEEERRSRRARREEIERELNSRGHVRLANEDDIEIADDISAAVVLESGEYVVAISDTLVEKLASELQSGKVSMDRVSEVLRTVYK